jgi:endonuclease/exonuclease/phosphatase (EEP) superfamily protein YafD
MALPFVAGVAVLVLPDLLFGLDRFTPLAQLVALRPYLLLGLATLVLVLLVLARWARGAVLAAAGMVVVLLVAAGMVAAPVPEGGRTLTVATFNTYSGGADAGEVAALIRDERPDVVSLVEAGLSFRSKLAPLVEPLGYRLITAVGEPEGDLGGVTAVVTGHLGEVRASTYTATPFPRVELEGGGLGDLRLVAFHTLAPRRGDVPQWRSDVSLVSQWCAGPQPAIIAGDFNATLDHSVLRSATAGCGDAAAQRWPGPHTDVADVAAGLARTADRSRVRHRADRRRALRGAGDRRERSPGCGGTAARSRVSFEGEQPSRLVTFAANPEN